MKDKGSLLEALTDQAEQQEEAGLQREALGCWRKAVKVDVTPYLLYRLGRLAMELEEWQESEDALLQAIHLAPDFPGPYISLGILYLERGDYPTAQDYLRRGLSIEETAVAYTLLGITQSSLGTTAAARWSFNKALTLDSNYEEAYYNLALTYKDDEPIKALPLLRKAVEIDPTYSCALRELGYTLRKLDEYAEAEAYLRQAIELDDCDGWAYVYLGNLKWATGELEDAEQAYGKAIQIWPDNSLPYWCLAHFYEYQGLTKKSESLYKKALEIAPHDPEANFRFGVFLRDMGEYSKARTYLELASASDPKDERFKAAILSLE